MGEGVFEVSLPIDDVLSLDKAVLIYRGSNGSALATCHDIDLQENKATLLAGKAMTPQRAIALATALTRSLVLGGFLPDNVLYLNGDAIVWWLPAKARHIAFKTKEKIIGERAGVVPHPALIFMASSRDWRVWAVTTRSRPMPDTKLCRAPYMNVYEDGAICAGTTRLPGETTIDKIKGWNEAFFGSFFTHGNGTRMVKATGGLIQLWRDLLDGKYKRFPNSVLVETGKTLRELVSGDHATPRTRVRRR